MTDFDNFFVKLAWVSLSMTYFGGDKYEFLL